MFVSSKYVVVVVGGVGATVVPGMEVTVLYLFRAMMQDSAPVSSPLTTRMSETSGCDRCQACE